MQSKHSITQGETPAFPSQLLGRNQERTAAIALLQQPGNRLLTLYGEAGAGKTSLAQAIASDIADHFPDGIFFIPLQDINRDEWFLPAISQTLELYALQDETKLSSLTVHMKDMTALLVLDGFEHLTSAAPMLAELVSACPRLKALVTSRTPLNLPDEQKLEIQPLTRLSVPGKTEDNRHPLPARDNHSMQEMAQKVLQLVKPSEPTNQTLRFDNLEREIANIRAVLEWSTAENTDAERLDLGLRIAAGLAQFWQSRSHLQEGFRWLEALLSRTTAMQTEARERTLMATGNITSTLKQSHHGRPYYDEALSSARQRNDLPSIMLALTALGNSLWAASDREGALNAHNESLHIATELGDKPHTAHALNTIGRMNLNMGEPSAVDYLERSVQLYWELGDKKQLGSTLGLLGRARLRSGDPDAAERDISEGMSIALELRDHWHISYSLTLLAEVATARRDYERAALLFSAAEANYDGYDDMLDHFDRRSADLLQDRVRRVLGEAAFEKMWSIGMQLTPEVAIAATATPTTLEPVEATTAKSEWSNKEVLSAREIEILSLLAQRLSDTEITERLTLSLYTVNRHIHNIYSKLNVSSRLAARRYTSANGIA